MLGRIHSHPGEHVAHELQAGPPCNYGITCLALCLPAQMAEQWRETLSSQGESKPAVCYKKTPFLPFKAVHYTNILKIFQNKQQLVAHSQDMQKMHRHMQNTPQWFP